MLRGLLQRPGLHVHANRGLPLSLSNCQNCQNLALTRSLQELIESYEQQQIYGEKAKIAKILLHRGRENGEPDALADEYYLDVLRDAHGEGALRDSMV